MLDFGKLMLSSTKTDEYKNYYIATLNTHIIVTRDYRDLMGYEVVGKIKVCHDGLYFGTPEEMGSWINGRIIEYLKEEGHLLQDGETKYGDIFWKLQA